MSAWGGAWGASVFATIFPPPTESRAMTILDICRNASDELRIAVQPTAIVGDNGTDARRLLRYLRKVGRYLAEQADWQALRKSTSFEALGQEMQTGVVPTDFDRFIPETFWNRSEDRLLAGPITSLEFEQRQALQSFSDRNPAFAYFGDALYITPAPAAGRTMAFSYVSTRWVQDADSSTKADITADTDRTVFDDELVTLGVIFEYYAAENHPSAPVAAQQFQKRLSKVAKNDNARRTILSSGGIFGGGRHRPVSPGAGVA